jgi:hypothetical protein
VVGFQFHHPAFLGGRRRRAKSALPGGPAAWMASSTAFRVPRFFLSQRAQPRLRV